MISRLPETIWEKKYCAILKLYWYCILDCTKMKPKMTLQQSKTQKQVQKERGDNIPFSRNSRGLSTEWREQIRHNFYLQDPICANTCKYVCLEYICIILSIQPCCKKIFSATTKKNIGELKGILVHLEMMAGQQQKNDCREKQFP